MFLSAESAAAGWTSGVVSRQVMNWIAFVQFVLLFLFPIALLAALSWSVGESHCRVRWGKKLAAFDALFQGKWGNSTVAASALRGVVTGLSLTALYELLAIGLRGRGVWPLTSEIFEPWWLGGSLPGVALLASVLLFSIYSETFGRLLLLPFAVRRMGLWLGGALTAILTGLILWPAMVLHPVTYSIPLWIGGAAVAVVLFLRYDLLTSLMSTMLTLALPGSMALLGSEHAGLQFQGALVLLGVCAPLIGSLRHVTSSKSFVYRYEDVPPHVRRIADRERQKVELETARRIQTSILPELPPELNGFELAHSYLPATEVGGDFYDVLALEDGRLAVAVGDVAGHGVSSGLVMSMAKSALAVQVTFNPEVEAVFDTLNRMVFQSARKRLLATLCYALIDSRRREMFYASAGHLFPYRVSEDGKVEALESVSYPLGVRDSLEVRVRAARLEKGDRLFLFSDGVVEARPEGSDEMFGFERLEESLKRHSSGGVKSLKDGVLDDIAAFTGNAPREDDVTVLVLRVP
jgi:hypothetical protein